jgi:hypothetical protein
MADQWLMFKVSHVVLMVALMVWSTKIIWV